MTLWQWIRCWLLDRGSCAYDPNKDEWLTTRVRPEAEAAERKVEAIRRVRASGFVVGNALDERREHG